VVGQAHEAWLLAASSGLAGGLVAALGVDCAGGDGALLDAIDHIARVRSHRFGGVTACP